MAAFVEKMVIALGIGTAVSIGAKRLGIPFNVALVVIGLVLVLANVLPYEAMDTEIILVGFLPALVFEGALGANLTGLLRVKAPILALAVPGVALSLLGTGLIAAYALNMSLSVALVLGALLSMTDTISTILAFRSVKVPPRLAAIMEGETLFNDGTGLVLIALTANMVSQGTVDPIGTLRDLTWVFAGGAAVGAALAAVGAAVLRMTPDHLTAILTTLVMVFATYLVATPLGASPIIAVVVAGLILGVEVKRNLEPARILALSGFWETVGFVLNVVLFLIVGMQIDAQSLIGEGWSILLTLIAVHVGRAIAVYGCFAALRVLSRDHIPLSWQHVMVMGNIKGALGMAAVLALPTEFPERERLISIVFGVTFVTMVTQALPFKGFLRAMKIAVAPADPAVEAAKVSLIAARKGMAELDKLVADGLLSRKVHASRLAAFQRHIIANEEVLRQPGSAAALDTTAELSILTAQKAALVDAIRRGLVSEDAAAAEIQRIDRAILDLGTHV